MINDLLLAIAPPPGSEYSAPSSASFMMGLLIFVLIFTLPAVFYLLSLQKCLNRCSSEVRTMSPGLVWLMLIPFFGVVWHFFVVVNIARSVRGEFQKRGIVSEPLPGQALGLAMCGLWVVGLIPFVGILAGIAGFVCWILYWVKVSEFSARLLLS